MNDRELLRHDHIDRFNTFGSENQAIPRFTNLAAPRAERSPQRSKDLGNPVPSTTTPPALQ